VHPGRTPEEETRALWYELGSLYAGAGGSGHRATKLGFTVVCVVGALVLLSAPLLGTAWAGPFAPAIPVATGLLSGSGLFVWERTKVRRRTDALGRTLSERGLDAERPAKEGLGAYHDTQLILLRSEYEYLRLRRAEKSARLFEETFGFTTEDPFETGPLNVTPDTEGMLLLRERWERRLAARRQHGMEPPALGMREDLAYSVFPREMTLAEELATRRAYLGISRELLLKRYGREPGREKDHLPDAIRRRMERDLSEYAALTERQARRS
jgi:hypothetical protein